MRTSFLGIQKRLNSAITCDVPPGNRELNKDTTVTFLTALKADATI